MDRNEAIKIVKSHYPANKQMLNEALEFLIPELTESEDDRIRKALIDYFRWNPNGQLLNEFTNREVFAWLKKQGEKLQGKTALEAWKDMRFEIYQQASGNRHEPNYSDDSTKMLSLTDIDEIFEKIAEKQGEQKPADKVTPKFHEGEWIIHQGTENIYQVTAIVDSQYQLKYGDNYTVQKCTDVDRCARLWNIAKDAKDGDVLAFKNNINGIIICKSPTNYDTRSYCRLVFDSFVSKEESGWDSTLLVPATKKQCDFLFQTMTEAGYTWDTESKQLLSLKTKPSDEQKPAWSEDDENRINRLIAYFEDKESFTAEDDIVYANWLKSLKKKIHLEAE